MLIILVRGITPLKNADIARFVKDNAQSRDGSRVVLYHFDQPNGDVVSQFEDHPPLGSIGEEDDLFIRGGPWENTSRAMHDNGLDGIDSRDYIWMSGRVGRKASAFLGSEWGNTPFDPTESVVPYEKLSVGKADVIGDKIANQFRREYMGKK